MFIAAFSSRSLPRRAAAATLVAVATLIAVLAAASPAAAGGGIEPKIATSGDHTCALVDNGMVWCWGENVFGQLGTGDTAPRSTATQVPGLSGVKSIGVYDHGTCAVKDGGVWCWGANGSGQLGQGVQDADPHPTPVQVPGIENTYRVSGGSEHVCSVTWEGVVSCWGSNGDGQLANGTVGGSSATPTAIAGVKGIHSLATGARFTCLSLSTKRVVCAGANDKGQLGDPAIGANAGTLVEVAGQEKVYEVRAGQTHVCGLSWATAGHRCWGDNSLGQLGLGVPVAPLTDDPPPKTLDIKHLGGSANATCAWLYSRRVACWGDGTSGATGLGSESATDTPTSVGLEHVATISSGSATGTQCAGVRGGTLFCWGANDFGQVGVPGAPASVLTPTEVPGLSLITRPQYPESKWIEPRSSLLRNKAGTKWRLKSRLTVEPSWWVSPEQACRGTVAADVFYWRKVAVRKKGSKSVKRTYEQKKVGVRVKSKLRLSGKYCKAYFVHKIPVAKFKRKKRRLRLTATGFGNDVQSKFTTGEYELKNMHKEKKKRKQKK